MSFVLLELGRINAAGTSFELHATMTQLLDNITWHTLSGPHAKLLDKGLISEESDQHQYRFKDIASSETGETLFTIEHEVRSMRHPLFMRPLVNRNPSQSNLNYAPGYDAWIHGMRQD